MLHHKHGAAEHTEKRFSSIIQGAIQQMDKNDRQKLFASFIDISPSKEGNLEFYLKAFYFIQNVWYGIDILLYFSKAGIKIPHKDVEEIQLVPFVRIIEFIRKFFERKLKKEDFTELKSKV